MIDAWKKWNLDSLHNVIYTCEDTGEKRAIHLGFTIYRLLLLKESSVQLKVNDSASITGTYVEQMMRLLIGL